MTDFKDDLLKELDTLKGTGRFVSINTLPFVLPGLEINPIGEIPFPLTNETIQKIIEHSEKSPFGLGMETVYDDAVRKGWEIDAKRLKFTNPDWKKTLDKAIHILKEDLGLEDAEVEADLYKILIYEEGSFFLKHKDTEKEKGMFGTLVIGLPSYYEGGEFEISFDNETVISDFSGGQSKYEFNFTAFYADCDHEVKPVKSGYRVVLTYNLIQKNISLDNQATHLGSSAIVKKISTLLTEQKTFAQQKPFIFLLDHQYTPESFAKTTLKLNDRYKASILLEVGEKLGYYSSLCLITSFISGGPSYDGYTDPDETLDIDEVYDEHLEIEGWLNPFIPKPTGFETNEKDFISPYKINDGNPIEAENTGYMGNWGPDIEHWYHYGAVVLWSKEANAQQLLLTNKENFLEWIDCFNETNQISTQEQKAVEKIILNDFLLSSNHVFLSSVEDLSLEPIVKWLINHQKTDLLFKVSTATFNEFVINLSLEQWSLIFENLDKAEREQIVEKINFADSKKLITKWLQIFNRLREKGAWEDEFTTHLFDFPKVIREVCTNDKKLLSKEGLLELFHLENSLKNDEMWKSDDFDFLKTLNQQNSNYLHTNLFPALIESDSTSLLFKGLITFWEHYLLERRDEMPLPSSDWTRGIPKNPRNKKIWDILSPFLLSPDEEVLEIRQRKNIREEFEREIKQHRIDVKATTLTQGSPHTLRLQKTQKTYEFRKEVWNADMKWLEKMIQKMGEF